MSLKAYLQALLNLFVKKSETEFICTQTLPKNNGTPIVFESNKLGAIKTEYVAPSNGWFCVYSGDFTSYILAQNLSSSLNSRIEPTLARLSWTQVYIPVQKGDSINVEVGVLAGQTQGSLIQFIPCVGT